MHIDHVRYEGIEQIQPDDLEYARELGLGLKLIGTAERIGGGLSVRVHPAFLYPSHPLASINGPFNAVTVESAEITEITMSGPGAGGPQTASAVLGDVISAMIPPASTPATSQRLPIVADVASAFYLHLEVADEPGVLARGGAGARAPRRVGQVGRPEGPVGDQARLVMVVHPVLESQLRRRERRDRRGSTRCGRRRGRSGCSRKSSDRVRGPVFSVVSSVVDWRAKTEPAEDAVSVACPWARERARTKAGDGLQPPRHDDVCGGEH